MCAYNIAVDYQHSTAALSTFLASAVEGLGTLHRHQRLVFPALVETYRLRCIPWCLSPE